MYIIDFKIFNFVIFNADNFLDCAHKIGLLFASRHFMTPVDGQKTELLQQVMDGLATAILLINRDLKLLLINPAGEMLLRSTFNHLHETPIRDWFPYSGAFAERIQQAFESTLPFHERELTLHIPMQGSITVDCMVTPVNTDQQGARNILLELTPLDRNIRISREENQLSQNNAIRALVRGLAHEIKNPLGGIRGAAQLLERELDSEELKEYTQVIIGEADRLRNLVNRLLGPSSLPQMANVNVHEVTERVRQIVEAGSSIEIIKDYDPSIPPLFVDRDHLIQSLLNIVGNATQAMEGRAGNITIRTRTDRQVTIGTTRHKLVCLIEVIDNGAGIAPEMLESIFFPMVTTRASGSGLGLPIAQSLVHQNGGLISCESEPGNTVFRLILPIPDGSKHEHN